MQISLFSFSHHLLIFFGCYFGLLGSTSAQEKRNDLNLVIAIDCSWSVSTREYLLQIGGIAKVFSDPIVIKTIEEGTRGSIGVTVVQWSTYQSQHVAVPWTQIETISDAIALANKAVSSKRLTVEGGTSIAGALLRGQALLDNAPFKADRHVIDVVADGENNNGERVEPVRDQLVLLGTTINGLAILNEFGYLHHYLRNRVIGGPSSFVEKAADYQDFVNAFRRKLLKEIKGDQFADAGSQIKVAFQK